MYKPLFIHHSGSTFVSWFGIEQVDFREVNETLTIIQKSAASVFGDHI